jgi:hypothetical protein
MIALKIREYLMEWGLKSTFQSKKPHVHWTFQ